MAKQENLQLIDDWLVSLDENDMDRWSAMHDPCAMRRETSNVAFRLQAG